MEEDKWISVEDRLPDAYVGVNVYGKRGNIMDVSTATFHGDYWWDRVYGRPIKVTHWMSFPKAPK